MDAKISISFSINNLHDLLRDDANDPRLKKLVQKSIDNLCALKQLLKDVDDLAAAPSAGSVTDRPRRNTTVRLLKAVQSVEDAADTFVLTKQYCQQVQKREQEAGKSSSCCSMMMYCCWSCCCCCCCCFNLDGFTNVVKYYFKQFFFIYKLKSFYSWMRFSRKMKKFNGEVRRLVEMKGSLNIEKDNSSKTWLLSSGSQRQHWGRISDFCLEEETQVVGLQQQINELVLRLIPQLINRDVVPSSVEEQQQHINSSDAISIEIFEEQEQLNPTTDVVSTETSDDHGMSVQVIAIIGEGGSGKTTLARSVYDSIDVKKHFTKRAWVRIPDVFKTRDVLIDILLQINQALLLVDATLSEAALMRRITKLLDGTRFLIVLDDQVDRPDVWESLIGTLSSSSHQGGTIVITTRNKDCLPPCAAHSTINICRLNDEESWCLFSKKVRIAEDELNNSELVTFKERILNICGGLPSVIVLLGGLLSTKAKSCDEWTRVVSMLANKTSEDVMAFCYQDLPSEVKPCLLYMELFPRKFHIPVRRLIHLWLAEGFVTVPDVNQEIDPEDVAEMFIEELITRNIVEVRWRSDESPRTCCMPSVLHDFFSSQAATVGFLCHQVLSSHTSSKYKKSAVRRLAANIGINYFPTPFHRLQHLRSYVAFDKRVPITPARDISVLLSKIISDKGFGLLRMLDLEGVFKPMLSDEVIEKLLLLTYLGLRSTFVDHLPDSVGQLQFLETLDVKHTNIKSIKLPEASKLRHIYFNFKRDDLFQPVSTNLRTLWGLTMTTPSFGDRFDLSHIRKLNKLGLTLLTSGIVDVVLRKLAELLDQMIELQSLKLKSILDPSIDSCSPSVIILSSMANHQKLQELYLLGNLPRSVIDVGYLPPNLRKLTLSLSELEDDPMPTLGQLPHLNILRLYSSCYKGEQMTCRGFPKLKLLKLWNVPVREWTVEEGAMPCLTELEIRSCDNLKPPQGLQNVTTLKELVITNMSRNFREAVEESLKHRGVFIKNNTWNSHPFPNIEQ